MTNKNHKIHVLFLPLWYPNKYDPMPGLFIERHAQSVKPYCDVSVLYIHSDSGQKEKYQFNITDYNDIYTIKLYYRQTKNNFPVLSQFIKGIKFFKAAFNGYHYLCKHKYKPQIIHVNVLTRLGVFALFLKHLYGLPYIITEHWSRYQPQVGTYNGIIRKFITKLVVKQASAVTTVSENLKNAMLLHNLKNPNYFVVPNVVNTNLFVPAKNKQANNLKQIIHVSCFDDKPKNISGILRVIKKLSVVRDDFKCLMIGDGPDLGKMKKYANSLEIDPEFICFTGLKDGENLVNTINQADIMLLFSNYENFPVVIPESFSCGIPVISTSVGGIPEHLSSDKGILIEPGNETQLLQMLNKMLDNSEKYNSKTIRQYAVNHFSYPVVGKQFFNIYMKVLK